MSHFRIQKHRFACCALAFAVSACSSEKVIGVRHQPPSVQIIEPSDGSIFFAYELVSFMAEVELLGKDELRDIEHQWVAQDDVVCDWSPVPSDGFAVCPIVFDDSGSYSATITVKDPRLDTATSSVGIEIIRNEAPSITVITPPNDSFFSPHEVIEISALVDDAEDSGEDLRVVGTSDIDGDLGFTAIPSTSGDWASNLDGLSSGTHLIELKVTDTAGQSAIARITVTINGKPDAPSVRIAPNPAASGDRLTAEIVTDSIDPEGDPVTYAYQWLRDGSTFAGDGVSAVLPSGITKKDEVWDVVVTARDPYGNGDPGDASITIGNSPPSIASVSIMPAVPQTTDDITAMPSGWFDQDDDPENYTYQWTVNGVVDADERDRVYPSLKTHRNDTISVTVTPIDELAEGTPVSSSTYVIANTPPTAGGVTVTPDAPEPLDELRCILSEGAIPADIDGDELTYVYTWYVDGVIVPEFSTTTPGTMAVLSWGVTGDDETWTCEVYADDGTDAGTTFSASVHVADTSRPLPPEFDDSILAFRNQDSVDLTGTCEPGCALDFACNDDDRYWDVLSSCTSSGTFSVTVEPLGRGKTTTCQGTCTDAAGNTSDASESTSTTVCNPEDIYENGSYGDSMEDPVDEWPVLHDDGTTSYALIGNVLDDDDDDWYVISAGDDVDDDIDEGVERFRFAVDLVEGTSDFSFVVYRDMLDGVGAETCMPTEEGDLYEDDTADFYVQVFRNPSTPTSCNHYSISVTNGVR